MWHEKVLFFPIHWKSDCAHISRYISYIILYHLISPDIPIILGETPPDSQRQILGDNGARWRCRYEDGRAALQKDGCDGCEITSWYPLVNVQKTMENHHLLWIVPGKMVIFHSFLYVYQRVGGKHPMIWFGWKTHPRMVVQDFATIHRSSQLMDEYVMICPIGITWSILMNDWTSLIEPAWCILSRFEPFWTILIDFDPATRRCLQAF